MFNHTPSLERLSRQGGGPMGGSLEQAGAMQRSQCHWRVISSVCNRSFEEMLRDVCRTRYSLWMSAGF